MASTLEQVIQFFGLDPLDLPRNPIEITNHTRAVLPQLFNYLGMKEGAEIGVEVGRFSKVLCEQNPGTHLYCVDAWQCYRGYREHVTQAKVDGFFETTKQRLAGYNCSFVREYSVNAAKNFKDGSLDYVYIDANHALEYVVADIAAWLPKVRAGGIISGHDYAKRGGKGYNCHVIQAVQAWVSSYGVTPWFVIGGTEPTPEQPKPEARSWMWVK